MLLHIKGHAVTAMEVGHRRISTSVHIGYSIGSAASMYVGHKTGSLTSKDVGLYEGLIDIKGCWISGQVLDIVDTECQGSLTNNNHNNNNNKSEISGKLSVNFTYFIQL